MDGVPIRFTFHERMLGPVAPGAQTPQEGAVLGRARGVTFVADLNVSIPDLSAFFADPRHAAELGGTVTCPGLASRRPVESGRLEMYVADPGQKAKLMRYTFRFCGDDGKPYCFEGIKILHTPLPSLRSQVTLLSSIRCDRPDGPLWGAGILVFRLRDLPKFLASMRAEGLPRLQALWRFSRFAQRELLHAPS